MYSPQFSIVHFAADNYRAKYGGLVHIAVVKPVKAKFSTKVEALWQMLYLV